MKYNDPYMDWQPMATHAPDCKRTGWDVRTYQTEHINGRREIAIRAICPESGGCGTVVEYAFGLASDRDPETGDIRSGTTMSGGSVGLIGYGTKPQRVGDVWLHAGPPLIEWEESPEWWYVTRSATPPATRSDTLGKVFALRKNGRQLKSRFKAGTGWTPRGEYGGSYLSEIREDLTSVRAAAQWVGQRAAELAAGGGVDE